MTLFAALEGELSARKAEGLWRTRRQLSSPQGARIVADGRELVAFASNDYLGLADDPALVAAAAAAVRRWGVGAGASHLLSGHYAAHEDLERELAAFVRPGEASRALLFSTGYLANLAIVSALVGRGDAVFADRLNHACLNDGVLLSRAAFHRYPRGDLSRLAHELAASTARRRLIATDAVFSMDGDLAPLPQLLELAERHDALLVVDDAHGFGVLGKDGRGSLEHFGLRSERIVYMGTLGKAAGVSGAFVAAHPAVIETLLQSARPYVFTTAPPPHLAATLLEALRIIHSEPQRRARLFALIARFRERMRDSRWQLVDSPTPIQPLIVGANELALQLADALLERGFWAPAIRPPTVPRGTARLRITLTAAHTPADVEALCDALDDCAAGR